MNITDVDYRRLAREHALIAEIRDSLKGWQIRALRGYLPEDEITEWVSSELDDALRTDMAQRLLQWCTGKVHGQWPFADTADPFGNQLKYKG